MSSSNDTGAIDNTLSIYSIEGYTTGQFWILLCLLILAGPSNMFALYYYLKSSELRRALTNHTTIILLVINLFYLATDMVWFTYYFHTGRCISSAYIFRLFWGYIDWGGFTVQLFLVTWATIERHILIFHDHLVATRMKRLLFHYAPPTFFIVYCGVYYALIIVLPGCQNVNMQAQLPSYTPCVFQNSALYMFDMTANQCIPDVIIATASVSLLVRIMSQKYRVHQQIRWRQHRRMVIQLLTVAFLYLALPTQVAFLIISNLLGWAVTVSAAHLQYSALCVYIVTLLYPIVCFASIPRLGQKFKNCFTRAKSIRVSQLTRSVA
jgi:hypothetical protein